MTSPQGAFFSSLDAETDGEEGSYYVWTEAEVEKALGKGEDLEIFTRVYGLDRGPNFDNDRFVLRESLSRKEVAESLHTTTDALELRLIPLRAKLLAVRDKRPSPRLDDKILTSWNGLMIAAYADAFRVLKNPEYRKSAETAADFLWTKHRDKSGGLLRTSRGGPAKGAAYLEDYAFLAHGLLRLHAATGDAKRLDQARELVDRMMSDFSDPDGGFFFTADNAESLFIRTKDRTDGALPGANSVAIRNLVAVAKATTETKYLEAANKALDSFSAAITETPANLPLMLVAFDEYREVRGEFSPKAATFVIPGTRIEAVVSGVAKLTAEAKAAPGNEVDVILTLTIDEGWHIYANPSGSEIVKPTQIELAPGSSATLVKVEYPKGKTMSLPVGAEGNPEVYESTTKIKVRVRLDEKADKLEFLVKYQPCNDRACLAPASLRVPLTFEK